MRHTGGKGSLGPGREQRRRALPMRVLAPSAHSAQRSEYTWGSCGASGWATTSVDSGEPEPG